MDAHKKAAMELHEKFREGLRHLKSRAPTLAGQHTDDAKALSQWLLQLQNTSFGRYLIQNGHLDGSWTNYIHEHENACWFNEVSSLAAMRIRHETITTALESRVTAGMLIGVFPQSYVKEWDAIQKDAKVEIIGVNDGAALLENENTFDLVIRNTFLYDQASLSEDIYAYIYASLKPGGYLLTSHWTSTDEPQDDLLFMKLLEWEKSLPLPMSDIKARLKLAGFHNIQPLVDENDKLRSVIAKKPHAVNYPEVNTRAAAHAPRRMGRKNALCKNTICPA